MLTFAEQNIAGWFPAPYLFSMIVILSLSLSVGCTYAWICSIIEAAERIEKQIQCKVELCLIFSNLGFDSAVFRKKKNLVFMRQAKWIPFTHEKTCL